MNTKYLNLAVAALFLPFLLIACGGDGGGGGGDPVADGDTGDSGDAPDAGDDSDEGDGESTQAQFSLLADNDTPAANAINGIVHASDGSIYAVGFSDTDDDATMVLAYNPDGSVRGDFGTEGVLSINVKTAGGAGDSGAEEPFGIVELADGDLLLVVNAADGNGADPVEEGQSAYLVRLDSENDFAMVSDFGDDGGVNGVIAGAQEVVFGWANTTNDTFPSETAGSFPTDTAYDLLLDGSGDEERVVVVGFGTAASGALAGGEQATDRDRYITRLLAADGTVDSAFNGGTAFTYSTPRGENSEDNARRGSVEADGSIVSAGYTDLGEGQNNHIILVRLLADGSLDPDFGNFISPEAGSIAGVAGPGIAVFNPFRDAGGFAECYAVESQSNGDYVTTGYGAANAGTAPEEGLLSVYDGTDEQDLVTFRVAGGSALDDSFGNPDAPGTQAIQSEGEDLADAAEIRTEERGRDLVVLPDDRTVQVGYYGGVPALYVFTADGQLDTSVDDDGLILLPHTPVNTEAEVLEQFLTVELSSDGSLLAVGTRGNDPAGARVVLVDVAQ